MELVIIINIYTEGYRIKQRSDQFYQFLEKENADLIKSIS
jgi:hypothetical protein